MKETELPDECQEVHAEIMSALKARGVRTDTQLRVVMYQWLERYAEHRDHPTEGGQGDE